MNQSRLLSWLDSSPVLLSFLTLLLSHILHCNCMFSFIFAHFFYDYMDHIVKLLHHSFVWKEYWKHLNMMVCFVECKNKFNLRVKLCVCVYYWLPQRNVLVNRSNNMMTVNVKLTKTTCETWIHQSNKLLSLYVLSLFYKRLQSS